MGTYCLWRQGERIPWLLTVLWVTGSLLHCPEMKLCPFFLQETPSTVSSRLGTSRAQHSSRPTPSNSIPTSRATRGSSRATVLPREPPHSTQATSKDKVSSMEATEHRRRDLLPSSSGLTAMNRASMEITSNKEQALSLDPS